MACGLYLVLGFWEVASFPPNFFCDEAAPGNWAEHLLTHGLKGPKDEFFPTFCPTGNRYTVGTTLYLQLPWVALWGKHWLMPRVLTVIITFLGGAFLAWVLRRTLNLATWWSFPLFLMANPAWFFHARTGYDAPLAALFFGLFLGFGISFLSGSLKAIYGALFFAALCFYTSASARLVMPLAFACFLWLSRSSLTLISWKKLAAVSIALALPYVRYVFLYPGEQVTQLRILGSFWTQNRGLWSRILVACKSYLSAWDPRFWLGTGVAPLRHNVPDMGLLDPLVVALAGLGVVVALRRAVRGPGKNVYRLILLCLLASPAAALVYEPGVSRQMFLIPVLCTLAVFGSSVLWGWLPGLGKRVLSVSLAVVLMVLAVRVGVRAVILGPPLDTDYGFYGWQWGAPQLFGAAKEFLEKDPSLTLMVSATSFNDGEQLGRFFLGDHPRLQWVSPAWLQTYLRELPPHCLFVFPWSEHQELRTDPKFTRPQIVTVLYDPSGRPAFAFCRLGYSPAAPSLIAHEIEERRKPVRASVCLGGEQVEVWHSLLDMGPLANAFDGNKNTLIRTMEANPLRLDLHFPSTHTFVQASFSIGAVETGLRVYAQVGSNWELVGTADFPGASGNRDVVVTLRPVPASGVRVEIEDLAQKGELSNVHLWELALVEKGKQ